MLPVLQPTKIGKKQIVGKMIFIFQLSFSDYSGYNITFKLYSLQFNYIRGSIMLRQFLALSKYSFSIGNPPYQSSNVINASSRKNTFYEMRSSPGGKTGQSSTKMDPTQQLRSIKSVMFPFPFEYTLQPDQFKYYDPRFTEQPIIGNLSPEQRQHILYVLQNFESYLNSMQTVNTPNSKKYMQEAIEKYIHPQLKKKTDDFLLLNKDVGLKVRFNLKPDSIQKTEGTLQILENQDPNGVQETKIDFFHPLPIHEYRFKRDKEVLVVQKCKKQQKRSQEQQLVEDIKQMMGQKSNTKEIQSMIKEQFSNQKPLSQPQKAMNYLKQKFRKITSPPTKKRSQGQQYILCSLVKGVILTSVKYQSQVVAQEQIQLYTKWMYLIKGNEPQSVKKSRKRILFDFQFWNRGTFFPVKDFAEISLKVGNS